MGRMPRRRNGLVIGFVLTITMLVGCSSTVIRSQNPEPEVVGENEQRIRLVREVARVWGFRPITIEGIGLISQLDNTGSDPPASPQRDLLLGDMQRRNVAGPGAILSSPTTSLALVRAQLPPGVQKGDRFDIEVMTPSRSETTSLRDGWLMQTRMQEMAVLGNRIREGNLMAQAEGAVVVNSLLESQNDARSETKGRILGGGVAGVSRTLGLVLTSEHHSVRKSSMVGNAVNARFHTYDHGTKRGVATPKRDNFIELVVHQRYRNNLMRYARVVQAIPVRETPHELMDRLAELEVKLQDPRSAVTAAVDLEAIGPEALPTLRKGLQSPEPLVRFAAAEALAYLNEEEAVAYLTEAARSQPAFRWHALMALSSMIDSEAHAGLAELLHEPSDETRYGAFNALVDYNPRDPLVKGEVVGDVVSLHRIASQTEPLIHVRRTKRPEVVFFGRDVSVQTPSAVFAGKRILVKSEDANRLKVTHFGVGDADRTEYCANTMYAMVRTIVVVGGSYTDVVAAISDAKQKGILAARVKFDALPTPGREYQLEEAPEADPESVDPELLNESGMSGDLAPSA